MARTPNAFQCRECGAQALKWQGQCPQCRAWDSLEPLSTEAREPRARSGALAAARLGAGSSVPLTRLSTGIKELDRVFGGGIVPGSVSLLGGEPGIGKSTLLLQLAAAVAGRCRTLYASGEESVDQVGLRAQRLGCPAGALALVADAELESILALARTERTELLIIDSIQTMRLAELETSAGSAVQLRECASTLVRYAKECGCAVLIVGHVTKEGSIAGPKLLEHLVDTVLHFEADTASRYRLLRASKHRFGAVNELGFFAMSDSGLKEVRNPSAIFLSPRPHPVPGSIVMVARDGGRPLLIEVQALVDRSALQSPRRVAQGVDVNRLSMLLAILSRHADTNLAAHDVFVNLVGGISIVETATDLPLVLALAGSLRAQALPTSLAVFGELGLTGEVRPVTHGEERLRELRKLGFERVILPRANLPREAPPGLLLEPVETVRSAIERAFAH